MKPDEIKALLEFDPSCHIYLEVVEVEGQQKLTATEISWLGRGLRVAGYPGNTSMDKLIEYLEKNPLTPDGLTHDQSLEIEQKLHLLKSSITKHQNRIKKDCTPLLGAVTEVVRMIRIQRAEAEEKEEKLYIALMNAAEKNLQSVNPKDLDLTSFHKYEILRKIATKSDSLVTKLLKDLGFSPEQRYEIAVWMARDKTGESISSAWQELGLSTSQLFDLIRLEVEWSEKQHFSEGIDKTPLTNQQKFEIALLAAAYPDQANLSKWIGLYGLSNAHSFEVAKAVAKAAKGSGQIEFIANYQLTCDQRFEVAKIIISRQIYYIAEKIENFDLTLEQRHILAKFMVRKDPSRPNYAVATKVLFKNIDHFKLDELPQKDRYQLAIKCFENSEATLYLFSLDLSPEQEMEYAHLLAKSSYLSLHISKFKHLNQFQRFELVKIAAKNMMNVSLSQYIQDYRLSEFQREEVANLIFRKDPKYRYDPISHLQYFDRYQLSNLELRTAIANECMTQNGVKTFGALTRFHLSKESEIKFAAIAYRQALSSDQSLGEELDYYNLEESYHLAMQKLIDAQPGLALLKAIEDKIDPSICLSQIQSPVLNMLIDEIAIDPMHSETQLKWLAGFLLHQAAQGVTEEQLQITLPLLQQLIKLRQPKMRNYLTFVLFDHLYADHTSWNEIKPLFIPKSHTHLFQIALLPLFKKEQGWDKIAKSLSDREFKDSGRQRIVFNALQAIAECQELEINEKKALLELAFKTNGEKTNKANTKLICLNLQLIEVAIKAGHASLLKKASSMQVIEEILQAHLKKEFNIEHVENLAEKYIYCQSILRYPDALLIYASKLKTVDSLVRKAFSRCVQAILENNGSYQNLRYEPTRHLEMLFTERAALKQNWQKGDSAPFLDLVQDPAQSSSFNIIEYLRSRICDDKHIDPQEFHFLSTYLMHPELMEEEKEKLIKQQGALKEALEISLQPKELSKQLKKLHFQLAIFSLLDEELSASDKIKQIDTILLPLVPSLFAKDSQFRADLMGLKAMLAPAHKQALCNEWTVCDTDEWQDMLLLGTEVVGSCQNINGDPYLNRCLTDYLTDGKNRAIVVKNGKGEIMARAILRMLYDAENKVPVLYQERLYQNADIDPQQAKKAIEALSIQRAKSLGLTLTTAKGDWQEANDNSINYSEPLHSYGSKSSVEYVDAEGKGVTNGIYQISEANLKILFLPNPK
jgi:hypothetical protein